MGPFADYRAFVNAPGKNNKLKWIDNGKNKNKLRTNPSEGDLVLLETVEPVTLHREIDPKDVKGVLKQVKNPN